ncbi:hypothetical protein [Saccharothrix stipae]
MITGEAGVRFVAAPPARGGRRLVVVWHLLGEPGTPEAMAEALPLTGVDAWRLYAALPAWGEGPDPVADGYAAMVESAVAAMPALVEAARDRLGCDDGPVDLVGGSAGGHVCLVTAARDVVAVRRVDVPLLVVRGEGEYAAFRPVQAALCAAVPGARLVDVPGLAHMLVAARDVVDAEVTAWLA